MPVYTRVGRTSGGPIVVTRDEKVAVATNRTAGVVTVFHLDPKKPPDQLITGKTELDFDDDDLLDRPQTSTPRGSEPWAAVLGKDDDTAYVIARRDSRVVRIVDLHGEPKIDGFLPVGSEPTSIAILPSGLRLFIANWGEGTISVVTTNKPTGEPDFEVRTPVDLNETLATMRSTGKPPSPLLGSVEARPGLAHPRALALTDDGDDDDEDETLFATEFFSQPNPGVIPPPPSYPDDFAFDVNRQGVVYRISFADSSITPISLAPVMDTGFIDSNDEPTGCFPNQLYAAAANADRLWVTSLCASPRGPLGVVKKKDPNDPNLEVNNTANFKTVLHPVLFAIDTETNEEVPAERRVLTKEIEGVNAASSSSVPRMPLIPNDLVFARANAGASEAFVTAMGADAVFRLGDPGAVEFLDVASRETIEGHLPVGTAVLEKASLALVLNDNSQNLSVVDLRSNAVKWVESTIDTTPHALTTRDSDENAGRLFFATGADVWSFKGQAWGSCEGCHPDGLSDGVTWFFARGPRRTISTAATYDDDGNRRVMLWTGNIDEVHDIEGIVRSVTGGVGAITWQYTSANPKNDDRILYDGSAVPPPPALMKPTSTLRNGLTGSLKALLNINSGALCTETSTVCDRSPSRQWDQIDAFVRSVRAPNRPTNLSPSQVERGASLFKSGRCFGCHGGPDWTFSRVFYTPGTEENGELPYAAPKPNPDGSFPDLDIGRLRRESYGVPPELRLLNPVQRDGFALFRSWNPPENMSAMVYLYGTEAKDKYDAAKKTHGNDQINCVLRAVGTYPDQTQGTNTTGIVPSGAPPVTEVRQDMTTPALGATGFNIPSLIGLATAGSYLHGGNARTLEEVFDATFDAHLRALEPGFLSDPATRKDNIADLVAYLLSIDDAEPPLHEHTAASDGRDLDLCSQKGVVQASSAATACTKGERRCAGDKGVEVCDFTGNWTPTVLCADGETCTSCSGTAACAPFPAPALMDDISVVGYSDSDFQLSPDELTAYFVSDRPNANKATLWTASRTSTTGRFGAALALPIPDHSVFAVSVASDGLTAFFDGAYFAPGCPFATCPPSGTGIYQVTRTSPTAPFGTPTLLVPKNICCLADMWPWLSPDGTRLYYDVGDSTILGVADRSGSSLGTIEQILPESGYAATLSKDELTLYFAKEADNGQGDVFIARRSNITDSFGPAAPVSAVNTSSHEVPDWISSDGCRLYLHRADRVPGFSYDVYLSEKK
jgi:DNA-binding beta-propeller fold protein YncE